MKRLLKIKTGAYYFGIIFEFIAGVVAVILSLIFGYNIFKNITLSVIGFIQGLAYTIPALLFFYLLFKIPLANIKRIEDMIINFLTTILSGCGVIHFAALSIVAGVCEELLFRGFLQGFLTEKFGALPGIIVANIAFGFMHPVSLLYACIVFVVGCYFSFILHLTNNLFVLMVTHATYDFAALCYIKYVKLK